MKYTVAIRTLGKAGDKYQKLLNSLAIQTIPASAINVYIAEGYDLPKETIGIEKYIYVKKGMVAQRALSYDDINTEYVLFLDDDVYLPPNGVESLYSALVENQADVISPDVFPNAERSLLGRLLMGVSGRIFARKDDGVWAYKVMRNAGYSYNNLPSKDIYLSQSNAGPCFFCKKSDMLSVHFEEEQWMDKMPYAMGEDQVMYYKMYLSGLKVLTIFNSGIVHLDAASTLETLDRVKTRIYCDFRFKTIFWHRFIYLPENKWLLRQWSKLCIGYAFGFGLLISLIKGQIDIFKIKKKAIEDGIGFIKSCDYKKLPKIKKITK